MAYEAVVIGVSAGGFSVLRSLLPALPADFPVPLVIVQHIGERSDGFMAEYLDKASHITVKEAEDKEPLMPATAYLAPPRYHLLIEPDRSLSLSVDSRVNYSCPSIDVLFESAAQAIGSGLIGVVLTGANSDGAQGLKSIKNQGGLTIVQNPQNAESSAMPRAAIAAAKPDHMVDIDKLADLLSKITTPKYGARNGKTG